MKGEDEPTNPKYISISSFPFDIKICTSKANKKINIEQISVFWTYKKKRKMLRIA